METRIHDDGAGTVGGPPGPDRPEMVMLQLAVALADAESWTLAVKGKVLTKVGVPVIAPVEAFRFKPCGREPVVMENVKGDVPPVATSAELNATFNWPTFTGQARDSVGGVTPVTAAPGLTIALESNVTAPVRAKALPTKAAPVVTVTDAWAMMVPSKIEPVPRVAELPTCQKILAACAPPWRIT